jgi:hypothetical protein
MTSSCARYDTGFLLPALGRAQGVFAGTLKIPRYDPLPDLFLKIPIPQFRKCGFFEASDPPSLITAVHQGAVRVDLDIPPRHRTSGFIFWQRRF